MGVIAESGVGGAEFKFVATSKDAGGLVIAKAAPNTSPAGLASSAGEAVAAPKSNTAGEEAGKRLPAVPVSCPGVWGWAGAEICIGDSGEATGAGGNEDAVGVTPVPRAMLSKGGGVMEEELLSLRIGSWSRIWAKRDGGAEGETSAD